MRFVAIYNGNETHIELKVGKVAPNKVMNFAEEVVADELRITSNPNIIQQYRLYSNDKGLHVLQDPMQAKILLSALQEYPDNIRVYLNDVELSIDDLRKYAFP